MTEQLAHYFWSDDQATRDAHWMGLALAFAAQAGEAGEVPVGAVVVDEAAGKLLAQGSNQPVAEHDPTAHAEIIALRAAGLAQENYRLAPNLTLYVTLEPCTMCAGAISFARVSRLVFGATDPKGGAVVSGVRFFDQPTCHWRPTVTAGVAGEEASALLKAFFKARRG
jgi:tRNA(adenine34) deaminase